MTPSSSLASTLSLIPGMNSRTRLYEIHIDAEAGADSLQLEAFTASEALSELYRYDLLLLSSEAHLSLSALIGKQVRFSTRLSDGSDYLRSGYISRAERLGADGALTRYRVQLVPWLWLTTQRSDCRIFQDKSVLQILQSVLEAYRPQAHWQFAEGVETFISEAPQAGAHSYCVQYRESDFDFIARLLAEEGLGFCFVEQPDVPLSEASCHSLLIFAQNESLPEDHCAAHALGGTGIRFHRAGSQEEQDAITALGGERQLQSAVSSTLSWAATHKRSVSDTLATDHVFAGKTLSAYAELLEDYEPSGSAFDGDVLHDQASTARYLRLAREASEARNKQFMGEGSVRSFRPGHRFLLANSPLDREADLRGEARSADAANASRHFLLYRVIHLGINNLPEQAAARTRSGQNTQSTQRDALLLAQLQALGLSSPAPMLTRALTRGYANHFVGGRVHIPWRPVLADETGRRMNPRPTAPGLQSAIVVGPQGERSPGAAGEIHTDAQHRIRVRFHWQSAQQPDTAAHTVWLRLASRAAGAGLGAQFVPRIGQEVLIGFLEGDIDRPIVLGSLFNGQGEGGISPTPGGSGAGGAGQDAATSTAASSDSPFAQAADHRPAAQGNLAGGHSPAWHGEASASGPHRHTAALSGFKSAEFNQPHAGYSQLVFDDTDGQQRIQLATTQASTQLNLGHLIHQADNYRGSHRGDGFELRSDAYGAVRAARGALFTTWGIAHAPDKTQSEPAGDATAPMALLKQASELAKNTSQIASTHKTVAIAGAQGSTGGSQSALSKALAPLPAQHKSVGGMVSTDAQSSALSPQSSSAQSAVPHSTDALLTLAAKGGLGIVAGQSLQWAAGETLSWASGQDSNFALASHLRIHTGQALGILSSAQGAGHLKAIAASGPVLMQAQADTMTLAAKEQLKMVSVSGKLDVASPKKIHLAVAGGSAITIEGGNITVQCPGVLTVHASGKSFVGGGKVDATLPKFPQGPLEFKFKRRFTFSV